MKPRIFPSVGSTSTAAPSIGDIPPPTPITTLQSIGINRCAIPASEVSTEALSVEPTVLPASPVIDSSMEDQGEALPLNAA